MGKAKEIDRLDNQVYKIKGRNLQNAGRWCFTASILHKNGDDNVEDDVEVMMVMMKVGGRKRK
jgi:hypothetical protein